MRCYTYKCKVLSRCYVSSAAEAAVPSRSGVRSEDAGAFHRDVKAEIVSHCHVKDSAFYLEVGVQDVNTFYCV